MYRNRNHHTHKKSISKKTNKWYHFLNRYPKSVIASWVLLLVGIAFILTPYLFPVHQDAEQREREPEASSSAQTALSGSIDPLYPINIDTAFNKPVTNQEMPTRILIPSLSVDVPITFSRLVKGVWQTSKTTASFGEGSAFPGTSGNSVIFAHAKKGLFLPLRTITKNTKIYLLTARGWYAYQVRETTLVNPKETIAVKQTDDETLTLFTCTGFLDSKRLIVVAKPIL